jgi:hypothetical protein
VLLLPGVPEVYAFEVLRGARGGKRRVINAAIAMHDIETLMCIVVLARRTRDKGSG